MRSQQRLWFPSAISHQAAGRSFNGETKIFRKLDGLPSNFVQCLYLDHNGVFGSGLLAEDSLALKKENVFQSVKPKDCEICTSAR